MYRQTLNDSQTSLARRGTQVDLANLGRHPSAMQDAFTQREFPTLRCQGGAEGVPPTHLHALSCNAQRVNAIPSYGSSANPQPEAFSVVISAARYSFMNLGWLTVFRKMGGYQEPGGPALRKSCLRIPNILTLIRTAGRALIGYV
jgi:hypothetical protein